MWLLIKHEVFTSSVALLCTSAALSFDTLVTESILRGPEHTFKIGYKNAKGS